VQAPARPALALVKTATPGRAAVGTKVRYTFTVTNTGNDTLHDVTVLERAFTGSGLLPVVRCPAAAAELPPGGSVACTAAYVITAKDAAAGTVDNTATARGRTSFGRILVIPPAVTAPLESAKVAVTTSQAPPPPSSALPGGVRAGFAGGPTPANLLLITVGAGLALGAAVLGSVALTRRR
jgi:hypothetical protein